MYVVIFDCGELAWCDTVEEAHVEISQHGYDNCGWEIYLLNDPIESSPQP